MSARGGGAGGGERGENWGDKFVVEVSLLPSSLPALIGVFRHALFLLALYISMGLGFANDFFKWFTVEKESRSTYRNMCVAPLCPGGAPTPKSVARNEVRMYVHRSTVFRRGWFSTNSLDVPVFLVLRWLCGCANVVWCRQELSTTPSRGSLHPLISVFSI